MRPDPGKPRLPAGTGRAYLAITRYALVLLIAACGGDGQSTEYSFETEGRLCIHAVTRTGEDSPQMYMADRPLQMEVVAVDCLSSGCSTDRSASCGVDQIGTDLKVTSLARFTDRTHPGRNCPLDCIPLDAICPSVPLAAGDYLVHFGTKTVALTIPSQTAEPLCVETD